MGRLLLAWVDKKDGEILFSWANSDRASRSNEWQTPVAVPSGSQVNSSPDVLADTSGRILIAFSIPINEQRGIYLVASSDAGKTWSQPLRVFGAADWDLVDQPKLSITSDGRLQVLFNRYSLLGDQRYSLGAYYTQSSDGGASWSEPEAVTDQVVLWDQMSSNDNLILHRFWQEDRQSMVFSLHEFSLDGGLTWSESATVSTMEASVLPASAAIDQAGDIHFMQVAFANDRLTILDQKWDGAQWIPDPSYDISRRSSGQPSITASISSDGFLAVALSLTTVDSTGTTRNQIIGTGRVLDQPADIATPAPVLIPTLNSPAGSIPNPSGGVPTSTAISELTNLEDGTSALTQYKNILGIALVVVILILIFIFVGPWRKRFNK
jgi:hypothetical protein